MIKAIVDYVPFLMPVELVVHLMPSFDHKIEGQPPPNHQDPEKAIEVLKLVFDAYWKH